MSTKVANNTTHTEVGGWDEPRRHSLSLGEVMGQLAVSVATFLGCIGYCCCCCCGPHSPRTAVRGTSSFCPSARTTGNNESTCNRDCDRIHQLTPKMDTDRQCPHSLHRVPQWFQSSRMGWFARTGGNSGQCCPAPGQGLWWS